MEQEERDSYELWGNLKREHPEYIAALDADEHAAAQIEPSFLGFIAAYKALATIIPLRRVVYDFGCCYAAQAWYFRNHAGYVGIEPSTTTQLHTPNATYHRMTAQEFLKDTAEPWTARKRPGFAIINYVPDEEAADKVKSAFRDVFSFYPVRGDHAGDFPRFKAPA